MSGCLTLTQEYTKSIKQTKNERIHTQTIIQSSGRTERNGKSNTLYKIRLIVSSIKIRKVIDNITVTN